MHFNYHSFTPQKRGNSYLATKTGFCVKGDKNSVFSKHPVSLIWCIMCSLSYNVMGKKVLESELFKALSLSCLDASSWLASTLAKRLSTSGSCNQEYNGSQKWSARLQLINSSSQKAGKVNIRKDKETSCRSLSAMLILLLSKYGYQNLLDSVKSGSSFLDCKDRIHLSIWPKPIFATF